MPGPMGYDKGIEGLRVPNEIEDKIKEGVYSDKTGPFVGRKCVGDSTSNGCWYCIATNHELVSNTPLPPHIQINECYCDWYRVADMIDHPEYTEDCPIYNRECW